MGLTASKIGKHISDEEFHEGSVPTTPILTPKAQRISSDLDPRSPSANISRTPLEILTAAAERLQNLEEIKPARSVSSNGTPVCAKPFNLGIDPRSPTTDFTRTPIILSASEKVLPKKLLNKNLDKVRLADINMSRSNEEESTTTKSGQTGESPIKLLNTKSPKLLESSPIKHKSDTHGKRKSYVGLLETNIDFTETDLDVVMQTKCKMITESNKPEFQNDHDYKDENLETLKVTKIEHSEVCTTLGSEKQIHVEKRSSENISNKIDSLLNDTNEDLLHYKSFEVSEDDINAPIKITNLISQENQLNYIDPESEEETNESIQIVNQSNSAPVSPNINVPPIPILVTKESKSASVSPPVVNITATVKELDKKLTNLIFEDDIIVCPRIVKLKEPVERSPLKNRNGSQPHRLQKLKVSDKPRKSEYVVSKIPVFKEKGKREIQCENTPPRKLEMKKGKIKKCNWDNTDTTLYL